MGIVYFVYIKTDKYYCMNLDLRSDLWFPML
jgi:hypothetical protein